MKVTSEVFIFIKTTPGAEDSIAKLLTLKGFVVKTTQPYFDFNVVIIFDSRHRRISDLQNEIKAISGVTNVIILPSFPA